MSALQSSLFNSRPARGQRQLRVNLRTVHAAKSDLSTPTQLSSEKTAGSRIVSEEWAFIQQVIDGDPAGAELIFGCHTAKLQRVAFCILQNKEDAEDAVQDSLCKAYTKLRSFQGRASFSTWLTRIVINSARMVRRKKNGRPESSLDEILEARPQQLQREIVDQALDPEQICRGTEIHELLEQQLQQLSPGLRAAFRLGELDGLSASESCRVLGIHENAFKSRISKARQKLGRALRKSLDNPRHGQNSSINSFVQRTERPSMARTATEAQ
jgi:RNA polymerase sigma-70 factor, ECF subfamily